MYMNYDFLLPQLFRLLTQCFDCHRQPSSGILEGQFFPCSPVVFASRLSHMWLSLYPPSSRFMTGVAFRIHMASLIHLVFLLHSLSITFVPSQSEAIVPVCMVCYWRLMLYNCWLSLVMFSTSFLCSSSFVPNFLCFVDIYVWLQLLQGIWYTVFLLSSTLSFGCTSNLMFWWCLTDVAKLAISWCF